MSVATQTDFRWLFMHELRLKFRTLVNPKRRFGGLGWAIALLVTLQGFALLGVWVSLPSISGPDAIRQSIFWILLFAMPIMFGAAMDGTVESFFKRGDLDLLLSSPVKPSRVLLVRWLAIAFNTLVTPLFLLIPVINAAIVLIAPKLVFSYLVLVSVALVMTAFGTVVASNLIRSVGPKLARRIGAIISTSSAAVPVLGPQLFRFLPNGHASKCQGCDASRNRVGRARYRRDAAGRSIGRLHQYSFGADRQRLFLRGYMSTSDPCRNGWHGAGRLHRST